MNYKIGLQVSRISDSGKLDSDRHLEFLLFQLCDVVLKIGVDSIHAHRVVLASVSPYFYAMFNGKCWLHAESHAKAGANPLQYVINGFVVTAVFVTAKVGAIMTDPQPAAIASEFSMSCSQ